MVKSIADLDDRDIPRIIAAAWNRVRASYGLEPAEITESQRYGWATPRPKKPKQEQPNARDWSGLLDRLHLGDERAVVALDFGISVARLCIVAQRLGWTKADTLRAGRLRRAAQRKGKS